jgi:hypothetical protein
MEDARKVREFFPFSQERLCWRIGLTQFLSMSRIFKSGYRMRCSTKIANDRFGYRVTCCLGARRHGCPRRYFHHVFVSLNWGGFVSPSTAAKLQFLLRKGTVWPNIARMVLLRGGALRGPELLKYSGESNFDPSILIVAGGHNALIPTWKPSQLKITGCAASLTFAGLLQTAFVQNVSIFVSSQRHSQAVLVASQLGHPVAGLIPNWYAVGHRSLFPKVRVKRVVISGQCAQVTDTNAIGASIKKGGHCQ